MAITIKKRTDSKQQIKFISQQDDAINWADSYADEGDEAAKRNRHITDPDLIQLRFHADKQPTLFVFHHPFRVDIARGVRNIVTMAARGKSSDLYTECYNVGFVGTEEGLDGGKLDSAPRRNGKIPDDFFQALEDSGVFEEMALNFIREANREKSANAEDMAKK